MNKYLYFSCLWCTKEVRGGYLEVDLPAGWVIVDLHRTFCCQEHAELYASQHIDRFEQLKGKVCSNVERYGDAIWFTLSDGQVYVLEHRQECCEDVYLDDVCGDLEDLIGLPLLIAEEACKEQEVPQGIDASEYYLDYSYSWTFYKLGTNRGYVTLRWFGSSNGYYSEVADLYFRGAGPLIEYPCNKENVDERNRA